MKSFLIKFGIAWAIFSVLAFIGNNGTKITESIAGGFGLCIIFCIYFIPSINASMNKHRNKDAITALNLLLGWTFIGWVAALVWSYSAQKAKATA